MYREIGEDNFTIVQVAVNRNIYSQVNKSRLGYVSPTGKGIMIGFNDFSNALAPLPAEFNDAIGELMALGSPDDYFLIHEDPRIE